MESWITGYIIPVKSGISRMSNESNWIGEEDIFSDVSLNMQQNKFIQKGSKIFANILLEFSGIYTKYLKVLTKIIAQVSSQERVSKHCWTEQHEKRM